MRKTVSMLSVAMLLSGVIAFNIADPAQADVIQADECFPAVLMLRGSGEQNIIKDGLDKQEYSRENDEIPFIETNGYEGERLGKLIQAFVNQTNPVETVSKTRFIGVDYTALKVFPDLETDSMIVGQNNVINSVKVAGHVIQYQDSYNDGASKVLDTIKADESRGCNTQYMIVGYSQGMISARLAINLLGNNEDKIISTYAIGDPVNKGNATLSERQISPAHATSDMNGILRAGLDAVWHHQLLSIPTWHQAHKTKSYLETMTNADSLIYKDDTSTGIYSRVLCHDQDMTCDANYGSGTANHTNYFEAKKLETDPSDQGDVDLEYEITAFDEQVQVLANSTTHNPRARVLKKTPSVNTASTLYNVANARFDDKCSWDEGNNGSYEVENIACDVYDYANTAKTESMRVKVTDSFGSNYFFELEDEVLEVEQIEKVLTLDPNAWYQFKVKDMPLTEKDQNNGYYYDDVTGTMKFDKYWKPSFTGDQCIDWRRQYPDELITSFDWELDMVNCKTNLQSGNAFDAMQVFKPSKTGIKSGYSEDHSLGIGDIEPNYMSIEPNSINQDQFQPLLTELVNDKAYYSFTNGKKCISAKDFEAGYTNLFIENCTGLGNQLFEATQIEGEFGALSMEKDVTAPNPPSNIFLEVDNAGFGKLYWDKITDRGMEPKYEVYKYLLGETKYELVDEIDDGDRMAYTDAYDMEPGDRLIYAIRALDAAGHYSEYSLFSFEKPEPVKNPGKPVMLNSNASSITLKLPTYNASKVRGVRVYDGVNYLGTYTGTSVTLNTVSGSKHEFSYRLEVADQIYSTQSGKLKITIP